MLGLRERCDDPPLEAAVQTAPEIAVNTTNGMRTSVAGVTSCNLRTGVPIAMTSMWPA